MRDARKVLHSAYVTLRSAEMSKAMSSMTLDHFIEEQINRLKGKGTDIQNDSFLPLTLRSKVKVDVKPSRWDMLESLDSSVKDVVEAIKSGKLAKDLEEEIEE